MSILEREMNERSVAIRAIGESMVQGHLDVTPKSETCFNIAMTALLRANEESRDLLHENS